jgi:hypothetical protein
MGSYLVLVMQALEVVRAGIIAVRGGLGRGLTSKKSEKDKIRNKIHLL